MYFLLNGYHFPVYLKKVPKDSGFIFQPKISLEEKIKYYKKEAISAIQPRRRLLFKVDNYTKIYLVYFDYDIGRILIESREESKAYMLCEAIISFFSIFLNKNIYINKKLVRLSKIPSLKTKKEFLIKEINNFSENYQINIEDILDRDNYFYIEYDEINYIPFNKLIKNNNIQENIITAMSYLRESYNLVNGNINESYYHCHYKKEELFITKKERINDYYENKTIYELAFLSAYKGIEAFFNKSKISKEKIEKMLYENNFDLSLKYKNKYKIFLNKIHEKEEKYHNIIKNFSIDRDKKSAHGNNKNKNTDDFLFVQNVFEIQNFLKKDLLASFLE